MSCENKSKRIILCGAYGAGNLGDEAERLAVSSALLTAMPELELITLTRSPKRADEIHSFDPARIISALSGADALILGGGSLLQNVTSRRSLYYYLGLMRLAKRNKCRVMLYGCGIGPISGEADIRRTVRVLTDCADIICLRDTKSAELLLRMGYNAAPPVITADPVLSLPIEGAGERGRGVCFIVREWRDDSFCGAVASAAKKLNAEGERVCFAMLNRQDESITRRCAEGLPVIPYTDSPEKLASELCKFRCVVSMRLHGLILAGKAGCDCLGLSYDPKIDGFAADAGITALPVDGLTDELILSGTAAAGQTDTDRLCAAEKGNLAAAVSLIRREKS